ncbi:MAG: hypothetical protein JWM11_6733, partial [Planctomycetaceae bacterium]|nr:hypothetical protein [Planctomycetaceae bacterium]
MWVISHREYGIYKFGSWESSMKLDANRVAVGKQKGIQLALDFRDFIQVRTWRVA